MTIITASSGKTDNNTVDDDATSAQIKSSTTLQSSSIPSSVATILLPQHDTTTTVTTWANATCYVLSGCTQPILMTTCRDAGLANSSSQLYMLFYYIGPALVIVPLLLVDVPTSSRPSQQEWPSTRTILRGCGIAMFDIGSQTLNYTGASLAGPTIFAIVYSSVTVWTAVFSWLLLGRTMNRWQWSAVMLVFAGLTLTATDSAKLGGGDVLHGLLLVVLGSIMHALTYVLLEGIMTVGDETLSVAQNCAVQGLVASTCFLVWQVVYTLPRWDDLIGAPMERAGTTVWVAVGILVLFASTNLVHAMTFLHTLRHFTGGATSAGVMKGLQAVLVFIATHYLYCGRSGGDEMCFTRGKFLSLITVAGGVTAYGLATSSLSSSASSSLAEKQAEGGDSGIGRRRRRQGYEQILDQQSLRNHEEVEVEIESLMPSSH